MDGSRSLPPFNGACFHAVSLAMRSLCVLQLSISICVLTQCVCAAVPEYVPVETDAVATDELAEAITFGVRRALAALHNRSTDRGADLQYVLHSVEDYQVLDYVASSLAVRQVLMPTRVQDPQTGRIFLTHQPILQPMQTAITMSRLVRLWLRLEGGRGARQAAEEFDAARLLALDRPAPPPPLQVGPASPPGNSGDSIQAEVGVSTDLEGFTGLVTLVLRNDTPLAFEQAVVDSGGEAGAEQKTLDVMSVNIFNYNHWRARKSLLTAELRRYLPGVFGFQEVRALNRGHSQTARFQSEDLFEALPEYDFVFQPAMGWEENDGADFVQEGLAIFSRYPILRYDFLKLSRDPNDGEDFHQRICLRAVIDTPIGQVNFMTTHLSLSAKARQRSLHEIGNWAKKFTTPSVLVGDFNTEMKPETDILQTEFGWKDVWMDLKPSIPKESSWTFNSWKPSKCIDFVKVHGLQPISVDVVGSEGVAMTGFKPVGGIQDMKDMMYASDHRFLLARVGVLQ
eukprot:g76839.t1